MHQTSFLFQTTPANQNTVRSALAIPIPVVSPPAPANLVQLPPTWFPKPIARGRPRLVEGEYKQVAQWSRRRDLLEKAHGTGCTIQQTRALIDLLCEATKVCVTLRWGSRRGRAYFKPGALPTISLPATPYVTGSDPKQRYGKLRVGLVLHEFAHVWAGPRQGHSWVFVAKLDALLEMAEGLY